MKVYEVRMGVYREEFVKRMVRAENAKDAERKFDEWFLSLDSDEVEAEITKIKTEYGTTDADRSDESETDGEWVIL